MPEQLSDGERMSQDILVENIDPNPRQARWHFDAEKLRELSQSIRSVGLIQPITVRPHSGRYEIVSGERRFRALKDLGHETITAIVRSLTDDEARWVALAENIQRDDLNAIEEATAYQQAIDGGLTQVGIGKRLGVTQSHIAHKLQLLKLPEPIRFYVAEGALTEGHARTLRRLKAWHHGLIANMDWWTELTTEEYREPRTLWNCYYRALRPEDNPPCTFNDLLTGEEVVILRDGLKAFSHYVMENNHKIPQWALVGFWFASFAVYDKMSVATLARLLDLWRARFYSTVGWCSMHGLAEETLPPEIDAADKEMWWGRKSDARFMGEYKWPRALVDEALTFCETQEGEILPSMLQPWGFQHDRYRSVAGDAMR